MIHLIEGSEQFQTKVFLQMLSIARLKSAGRQSIWLEWLMKDGMVVSGSGGPEVAPEDRMWSYPGQASVWLRKW